MSNEQAWLAWATRLYNTAYHAGHHDTVEGGYTHVYPQDMDSHHEDIVQEWLDDNPKPTVQGEAVACEVVGRAYHESFGNGVRLKLYIDAHQWPITEAIPIGTKLYFRPPQRR